MRLMGVRELGIKAVMNNAAELLLLNGNLSLAEIVISFAVYQRVEASQSGILVVLCILAISSRHS